jgi:CubicO group peptidase (beta-lactamase class C family)
VERDTVYDLASLTKVLSTTTLVALFVSEGRMQLDDEVPDPWRHACPGATLVDLLEHSSGLPAHCPFYDTIDPFDRDAVLRAVSEVSPERPLRPSAVYSDLGFIILGAWLERVSDRSLDELFRDRVAFPLSLDRGDPPAMAYRPLREGDWLEPRLERIIAPTEVYDDPPQRADYHRVRTGIAHGQVHDDNAYVMGGVAGHAGLFGSARAVADLAAAWLEDRFPGLDPAVRARFWRRNRVAGSAHRLGWDGATAGGSTGGAFSSAAVGHLGFTGTSLWIDPGPPARIVVLLSNAVHPHRAPEALRRLRPRFHQLAARL